MNFGKRLASLGAVLAVGSAGMIAIAPGAAAAYQCGPYLVPYSNPQYAYAKCTRGEQGERIRVVAVCKRRSGTQYDVYGDWVATIGGTSRAYCKEGEAVVDARNELK